MLPTPEPAQQTTPRLVATTDEAVRSLGGKSEVSITEFPFKVGRESRSPDTDRKEFTGLRLNVAPELNDLYLLEPRWSDILQISREHFAIESTGDGFFLVDRQSACGTIVAGKMVGGNRTGGRTELRHGDVIVVGLAGSEYAFRFEAH